VRALILGSAACLPEDEAAAADRRFMVYEHWRPDTGQCFYVGKGVAERARSLRRSNRHHTAVRLKLAEAGLGIELRIVAAGLPGQEALDLEACLIAKYGRRCDGSGPLVNLTLGGDGFWGYRHTAEHRAKNAAAQAGRKATPETRAKLSAIRMGHPYYPKSEEGRRRCGANRGKTLSAERRQQISAQLSEREIKPETRRKLSAIAKGNKSFLGRKHSQETIAKMKVAATLAWKARKRLSP
jgi:hypothetical protein